MSDPLPWQFLTPCPPALLPSLSPKALAYLGDAVFELYVRCHCLLPPRRIKDIHRQVVEQVRAEQQSQFLSRVLPQLTETEKAWVKRGRNAASTASHRGNLAHYQAASGLETLLGYLYLTNPQRLQEILALVGLPEP